jgi:hypothetical protein
VPAGAHTLQRAFSMSSARAGGCFLFASTAAHSIAACRGPVTPPPHRREAFLFIADGEIHAFPDGAAERAALQATLATMGSAAIECPAEETRTERVDGSGVACAEVWTAQGCGRQTSYVVFTEDSTPIAGVPGDPVLAKVEGIVRMSNERANALREMATAYGRLGLGPVAACFPAWIEAYFDLQAHGARDLDCPRAEVVPLRFSRGAMAEGCGKRASYWGDRLSCVVQVRR